MMYNMIGQFLDKYITIYIDLLIIGSQIICGFHKHTTGET